MGSRPATTGSIFVDRKKNRTSVHFFTGRIDSAYAAGRARTRTKRVEASEATVELISAGQGLAPPPPPENSREPARGGAAPKEGGLVAASVSEWKDVRAIHAIGRKNTIPSSQATRPRPSPLRGTAPLGFTAMVLLMPGPPPHGTGTTRRAGRRSR